MELYSMLCGSLDGRGVWGRTDTCMAESLHLKPLQHCYLAIPQYKIKSLKLGGKKKKVPEFKIICH